MGLAFCIEPLDQQGNPDATATTWYIKQGSYVHCTCRSPEVARAVLQHMAEHDAINEELKKTKISLSYELQGTVVDAHTNLAGAILRFVLRAKLIEDPAPSKLVPAPASPQKANPSDAPAAPTTKPPF